MIVALRAQLFVFLTFGVCFGFLLDNFISLRVEHARSETLASVFVTLPVKALSEVKI
jgi:hypothetical protein